MLNVKKVLAGEVMNRDLVSLKTDMPVSESIVTLEDYHITGAPVVDSAGECVGVFSTTDVLRRRKEIEEGETPHAFGYFHHDPLSSDSEEFFVEEDYDLEVLGQDTVGEWMTGEIKSVLPGATIEEVCRKMASERIHRVLVMEGRKLLGILTSFDIVRMVAGLPASQETPAKRRAPARRRRVK